MSMKLIDNARGLPWIKSIKVANDDVHSDRLNHRYTTGFLMVCAIIAAGSPFVFSRITCWVPAQFVGAFTKYTENYCWISNTYYIPTNESIPYSKFERGKAEIGYYQWAPLIFLVGAFFFYLPRMLWRSLNTRSGIDIQYLISKKEEKTIANDNHEKKIAGALHYYCDPSEEETSFGNRCLRTISCTSGKRLGNYLSTIYLLVKFLYLLNSGLQLIFVQIILGHPGWFYGFDIWQSIFIRNSVLTDSPYFPRVTLCDLRIREVGNLHRYTVQCVLPINMLNEKTFSLVWFWFFFVFISNFYSFLVTFYETLVLSSRYSFVRDLYRISVDQASLNTKYLHGFTEDFLGQDGVMILHLVDRNGPAFLAAKVVKILYSDYEEKQRQEEKRRSFPPSDESVV